MAQHWASPMSLNPHSSDSPRMPFTAPGAAQALVHPSKAGKAGRRRQTTLLWASHPAPCLSVHSQWQTPHGTTAPGGGPLPDLRDRHLWPSCLGEMPPAV